MTASRRPWPAGKLELEPELKVTVLARCSSCGAPHPEAHGLRQDSCPSCGAQVAPPTSHVVAARLSGSWTIPVRALLALGRWLKTLAQRI
jgi:hypothetical protein